MLRATARRCRGRGFPNRGLAGGRARASWLSSGLNMSVFTIEGMSAGGRGIGRATFPVAPSTSTTVRARVFHRDPAAVVTLRQASIITCWFIKLTQIDRLARRHAP